jgi:hypothetical protein
MKMAYIPHCSFLPAQDPALIRQLRKQIRAEVLSRSPYIKQADFTAVHPADLRMLFRNYDDHFFARWFETALKGRRLDFRLAPRMTRTGGKTTQASTANGEVTFEIAVACGMLFDAFTADHRQVSVCGLPCDNRLEALQLIFEHELVHLLELLTFEHSDCSATRFQEIAASLFLHRAHTHSLITRQERAATRGIHRGALVAFTFEAKRFTGRVNRITKRATVLVEHAEGQLFSDGRRYQTYYVPLADLVPLEGQ